MNSLTITYLALVAVTFPWTEGQFPRVCTTLDSLKNKECCPIPKGFTAPCGSDGNRGTCQELIIRDWNFTYSHYQPFQKDDERHDWPHALYHRTCKCNSNFAGYDCTKCEFGYYGSYCTQKKTLTRKKFLKLSDEEKDRYMRYINMSRYFVSDYVVTLTSYKDINKTVMAGRDPRALFYNVSYYDLFVWMHYYSTRETVKPNNRTASNIDFAHKGHGTLTWHRLFLLVWERTLQEIAKDDNFALPFWDWTAHPEECDPAFCSEELLGVTNQTDGMVKGKYFDDWKVICTKEQTYDPTKMCDPLVKQRGMERLTEKEKKGKVVTQGSVMTFPTKEDVNFALRFETFDLQPYNGASSCVFRNILEGFADSKTGYHLPNTHSLHNRVHVVIGGEMEYVPSAANDPLFHLHHCFVDRIYEKWLRKFNKDASVLSTYDAPIGHNKDDVIVSMFPLYTHQEMFKKSFEFGYDYEDVDENGKYMRGGSLFLFRERGLKMKPVI